MFPKYAPLAVIASEDQTFFEHFGFDFGQIEKAMKENEMKKNFPEEKSSWCQHRLDAIG